MNEQITGALFKQMVLHGAASITAQKQAINDLNVFPVPDGDTGTNMSMTIATAVAELRKGEPATLDKAASTTASALLRGARGNSGVILSLLFRGMSKALKGCETADAATFAALQPPTNFFVMMMGLSKAISNTSADVILPTLPPPKNEPIRARLFTSSAL